MISVGFFFRRGLSLCRSQSHNFKVWPLKLFLAVFLPSAERFETALEKLISGLSKGKNSLS